VSRPRQHLSIVVDEVLAAANEATARKTAETHAIKVAAAQPKTETARGLRALADTIRTATDDVSYDDFMGAL
jgi:hypothetical protein